MTSRPPTLAPLLRELRARIPSRERSGVVETGLPGVLFFWMDAPTPRSPLLYEPGLILLGQGHKVGYLGGRRYDYDADTCLVLGVPVPFECASHGTADAPLLGLRLQLDVGALHGLVARFAGQLRREPTAGPAMHSGVEGLPMSGPLLDAARRLVASLEDPLDRQVIGPAAVDELLYRVLRSPQGRVLFTLTQHQSPYAHVARALERIHRTYATPMSVEDLAHTSGMGVSSFHRAFKEVTGETPVQYLKKVRLLKAKGLLVFEGKRVDEAAYAVGYASPSQFSREFRRYFDVSPSEARSLPYNDGIQPHA